MIAFPPEYVKTAYPGYFWNTKTNRLYSIKTNGEMKTIQELNRLWTQVRGVWTAFNDTQPYYRISVKGVRLTISKSKFMADAAKSKSSKYFVTETVDFQEQKANQRQAA